MEAGAKLYLYKSKFDLAQHYSVALYLFDVNVVTAVWGARVRSMGACAAAAARERPSAAWLPICVDRPPRSEDGGFWHACADARSANRFIHVALAART